MNFSPVIVVSPKWPEGIPYPAPPSRPSPVASLLNEFEFEMTGVIEDATPPAPREVRNESTHFTARSRIVLPTGWRAIEVYPLLDESHWLPEAASQWAETDLLFALFQRNTRDQELAALDGRAEKRRQVAALLSEFETLLAGAEEPVHQFLKQNPILLYPTYDRLWSKVPFGEHVSDFVVRESPGDYVLVEIEAPYRELFRQDGHPRYELTHAIDQINDWLAYLADHRTDIESKYEMRGISASPRALVVIGRASGLTDDNRRKIATMQERQPRLRIMTYDDVIANARAVFEKILGPLSLVITGAQLYYHGPRSL
jgi:Shedu protein SduA, C-terminal